jgi:beta-xylosidase
MDGPYKIAQPDTTHGWEKPMIWAAEITFLKGKYYYFATFTNRDIKIDSVKGNVIDRRACHILVSDKPDGPYTPMHDPVYLPANKPTLDATLWIDKDNKPYMIYCHEWLQNWNGTVEKIELKPDFSGTVGRAKFYSARANLPGAAKKLMVK